VTNALLILRAVTGIHAGSGQEFGTVDLPIQRERVTNFPIIRGPSLKGAIRQRLEESLPANDPKVEALFGPDTNRDDEFGGALSVGDARVVLFPMRSVKGTFAWTTSKFVLARLKRDLEDAGLTSNPQLTPSGPAGNDQVRVASGAHTAIAFQSPGAAATAPRLVVVEDHLLIEDAMAIETSLVPALAALGLAGVDELKQRLAVVHDDRFRDFVSFCTEVVTRIHLDDETKTVKRGQLWTEELLPAETVLAASLICVNGRNSKTTVIDSTTLMGELKRHLKGRFQIGGNETVGYGVCRASLFVPIPTGTTQGTGN
jgi:CRISPR-associated protein Cmr4